MGKTILPTRIECGETTVEDKNTVLKVMLYFLLGGLLVGCGIGMFIVWAH